MKEELLLEFGKASDQKELSTAEAKKSNNLVANNFFITLPWSPQVIYSFDFSLMSRANWLSSYRNI